MDDTENKLGAILNNPQMMQQIMALAQSFNLSEQGHQQEPCPPKQEPQFSIPDIDLATIQKLSGFAKQSGIDKNQSNLLKALGPYLSRQRISKLERAMRAAKMAGIATAFLGQSQRGR